MGNFDICKHRVMSGMKVIESMEELYT